MAQERLEDLMIISCERDISDTLDTEKILETFANESIVLSKHII